MNRRTLFPRLAVSALLLSLAGATASAQQAYSAVAVKKGTFNWVRVAPEHHAHILEKVRQGTLFTVVGKSGAYYAVILPDGVHGWLHESNVRFQ